MIFVFGSNLAGIHGAGAAAHAYAKEGAIWGVGVGLAGNSYALPTKGERKVRTTTLIGPPLSIRQVRNRVNKFLDFAKEHPEKEFKVTRIGCGLAGFNDADIAPMFSGAPSNCYFDGKWEEYLPAGTKFWGTI